MPVVVSSAIPAGSAPEATENVAAGLPVAVKRYAYVLPSINALGVGEDFMSIGAAEIGNVAMTEPLPDP
jgi:hypothetical protein